MRWCRPLLCLLLALGTLAFAPAQLTPAEKQGIQDSLFVGNMTLNDLKFSRILHQDRWRMALVQRTLEDPLAAADQVMALHNQSKEPVLSTLLQRTFLTRNPTMEMGSATVRTPVIIRGTLPPTLRRVMVNLATAMATSDREISIALSSLNLAERRELFDGLPNLALEENSIKLGFVERPGYNRDRILALLGRVETDRILAAGFFLTLAAEAAVAELKSNPVAFRGKVSFTAEGIKCVVAGTEADTHSDPEARLILDLGGDDQYRGRAGAGRGNAGLLIDLGGNDRFQTDDLSLGAGLLGVGIAFVSGGNDLVETGNASLGWGVGGLGVWAKEGGDDHYTTKAMGQGFGAFGVGICLDRGGSDTYRLAYFGQGAGRTSGIGWLIDSAGDDIYRAGGLVLNSPLFADVHYSMAQGMGMGYREDSGGISGGIGLLTDWQGDDSYLGETYCQSASYWYSLGSLLDAKGNDSYSAHHYAQSSAMHLTSAYLFDLAGSDSYSIKLGAGHAIGHDLGVAFFLDRAGNDLFASRDSNPGIGTANGLAIFVDGGGDDRYIGPPGQGNASRGTGSLGVFVDLAGADLYATGLRDGEAATGSRWGTSLDLLLSASPGATPTVATVPTPGSRPMPPAAELEELYRKATQWGVGTAQAEVAASLNALISIGNPAWEWMVTNKLAGADRLQIRAFGAVGRALLPGSATTLSSRLPSASDDLFRQILRVAVEGNMPIGGSLVPFVESKPTIRLDIIRACGNLRAKEAANPLMRYLLDQDQAIVRATMISLDQISEESTASTAFVLITHPDLMTRKAAFSLLARFPSVARPSALDLVKSNDETRVRLGLELLAVLATPDLMSEAAKYLTDPRPGVRISALQALDGRVPPEARSVVEALKRDPSPVVQAVARRIR